MPFINGVNGSKAAGREISWRVLDQTALAMSRKADTIRGKADRERDGSMAKMYYTDANRMDANAELVAKGLISKAASKYANEDTAARDEYPFAFHRLLRSLGYLSWLRGYPGDK